MDQEKETEDRISPTHGAAPNALNGCQLKKLSHICVEKNAAHSPFTSLDTTILIY